MELKCTNPNGGILLASKLNHEQKIAKIAKVAFRNDSYKLFFSKRCSNYPKNKNVHNFLITNPNEINQSFPDR